MLINYIVRSDAVLDTELQFYFKKYDHSNFKNDATAINLIFQKGPESKKKYNIKKKLKTVNKLEIKYKEKIIKKTVLISKLLNYKKVNKFDSHTKLYYCLKLFYIAEAYRMSKTLKNVTNFEDIKIKDINNMIKVHKNIYKTIMELKNEICKRKNQ